MLAAAGWMIVVSLLLFWLPIAGPAIAGWVGGRKAGALGKAVVASLIPAILLGALVGGILALFDLPVVGTVAGIGVLLWVLVEDVPMVIAAAIAGALSEGRL